MSTKCACQSKHGNYVACNCKCNVLNCTSDSLCENIYHDLMSTKPVLPKGVFVAPEFFGDLNQSYREPPPTTLLNDSYGISADSEELTPLHPTPSPPSVNFIDTTFYGSTKLNYSHCPPKNMFGSPRSGVTPISDYAPVMYNVNGSPTADLKSQIDNCCRQSEQYDGIIKLSDVDQLCELVDNSLLIADKIIADNINCTYSVPNSDTDRETGPIKPQYIEKPNPVLSPCPNSAPVGRRTPIIY